MWRRGAVLTWCRTLLTASCCASAVQPSTGDVLLDCFPDGPSRSELESRILRINPVEVLVPSDLSEQTSKLLLSIANASEATGGREVKDLKNMSGNIKITTRRSAGNK